DTSRVAEHVVQHDIAAAEDDIFARAVPQRRQGMRRADNHIERAAVVAIERLGKAALIDPLRLDEPPVVCSVVVAKVANDTCRGDVAKRAGSGAEKIKRQRRRCSKGANLLETVTLLLSCKQLGQAAPAIRAKNAEEQIHRMLDAGRAPLGDLCPTAGEEAR